MISQKEEENKAASTTGISYDLLKQVENKTKTTKIPKKKMLPNKWRVLLLFDKSEYIAV